MKQIIKGIERYSVKDVPFISVMFETTSTGKQTTNNYFVIDGCYERNLSAFLSIPVSGMKWICNSISRQEG